MILKLKEVRQEKFKQWQIKRIVGETVDGEEYDKKFFFANDKKLNASIAGFSPGDWIDMKLDNSKYKNILDFVAAEPEDVDEARNAEPAKPKAPSYKKANGGTRGDDTNRSAAIYWIKDVIKPKKGESDEDFCARCVALAEGFIYPYIVEGKVPMPDSDPLDPPDVE